MNTTLPKPSRLANLDLLRILSMFLIVLLHSVDHSGVLEAAGESSTFINYYTQVVFMLTKVCVNCYVLISGYFLVKSQFHIKKLISLWISVSFYSFGIKLIFMLFDKSSISIASLLSSFFSVTTGRYWFITIYFGLYLISPFLNILINKLSKKQLTSLLVILFILLSVLITIHPQIAGMNSGAGWGLPWFVFLYLSAAWIRLYYKPSNKKIIYIVAYFMISIIVGTLYFVSNYFEITQVSSILYNLYRYDSVPVYIASLCIFVFFINIKIKNNFISKAILITSPLTFGVYLIHAHPQLSPFIWETLNLPQYMNSYLFPLIQIGVCAAIFIACALIDYLKSLLFIPVEKYLKKSKILTAIDSYVFSYIND